MSSKLGRQSCRVACLLISVAGHFTMGFYACVSPMLEPMGTHKCSRFAVSDFWNTGSIRRGTTYMNKQAALVPLFSTTCIFSRSTIAKISLWPNGINHSRRNLVRGVFESPPLGIQMYYSQSFCVSSNNTAIGISQSLEPVAVELLKKKVTKCGELKNVKMSHVISLCLFADFSSCCFICRDVAATYRRILKRNLTK